MVDWTRIWTFQCVVQVCKYHSCVCSQRKIQGGCGSGTVQGLNVEVRSVSYVEDDWTSETGSWRPWSIEDSKGDLSLHIDDCFEQ